MSSGSDYRRVLAANQFHRARRQAAIESLLARLSGQSADLLSYDQVVDQLGISGQWPGGMREIPIKAIVGSVGRYQDFTRTFLPRLESDEDRWVTVGAAAPAVGDLPPIDVYKIGDNYFVLDGNHRVSIARQQGLSHIDAYVTEVRTRVPLPPGARPDDLIIAAEYSAFLEYTRLDMNRADVDMRVSVPGQYSHLENAIEAYRYRLETESDREMAFEAAAARWYDEAYLPIVVAIRQQGILRYFPGRTETDFFIWLSRHRSELEGALGQTISPEVAVTHLLPDVAAEAGAAAPHRSPLRRLTQLVAPTRPALPATWVGRHTLARYADRLFASILAPVTLDRTPEAGPPADLERALAVVRRAVSISRTEQAQLTVLVTLSPDADESAALAPLRALLDEARDIHGLVAQLSAGRGDAAQRALEVALLNDLIVLDRDYGRAPDGEPTPSAAARRLVHEAYRPVLLVGPPGQAEPQRALLVHDTRRKFDEAVFLAAYVAELWGIRLAALPISNGRNTAGHVARTADYLALHEVSAAFLEPARATDALPERIVAAAHETEAELIILPGPGGGQRDNRYPRLDETIMTALRSWPQAILVAC